VSDLKFTLMKLSDADSSITSGPGSGSCLLSVGVSDGVKINWSASRSWLTKIGFIAME